MAILCNRRGLNGKKTTPVAMSTAFWKALIQPEVAKVQTELPYDLYHVTNTDLDLMIILHKICNTNGRITETSIHQIYQAMYDYFEAPASHTQVYLSMDKFLRRGLITEEKIDTLSTYQLNYFINEETNKPYRYVVVSPAVFRASFSRLTLAARKLFFMAAFQQGTSDFVFRLLHGENGLLHLLHKTQPNHLRAVLDELQGENEDNQVYLRVAKLEKKRGRYYKVYFGLHKEFLPTMQAGDSLREPLTPPRRYPRKALFIERVLTELGIGEMATQMNLLINSMKRLGYRVIRQVLRQLKDFWKRNGHFPKDLAHFLKKETRITREKEICDLAIETGLYDYIAPTLEGQEKDHRIFEFVNAFSWHSVREIKHLFKQAYSAVKEAFPAPRPITLESYQLNNELSELANIEPIRLYAYRRRIAPTLYEQLEQHAITYHLHKGDAFVCDWLQERIEQEAAKAVSDAEPVKLEAFILSHSS